MKVDEAVIPNPIRIACTECHRDARVEFQIYDAERGALIVAAECGCGRVIAAIDDRRFWCELGRGLGQRRPLIASDLQHLPTLGLHAKEAIAEFRDRIAHYERVIAAATWASEPRGER